MSDGARTELTEKGLGSYVLKCIAMAAMLCDHASVVFLGPDMTALRWIGRLACPIFCFCIAVGAKYTRSMPKYLLRLLVFALLSEIPFDLAFSGTVFDPSYQNVFFTLLGGLFCIWCLQLLERKKLAPLAALPLIAVCVLAELAETDYGAAGVLAIFAFYLFRRCKEPAAYVLGMAAAAFLLSLNFVYIPLCLEAGYTPANAVLFFFSHPVNKYELGALAAVPLLLLYTGRPGLKINKYSRYLFYAFYPAHLLILWGIRCMLAG